MPPAVACVYSLWISSARNVRNTRGAALAEIAPQAPTRNPQLLQRERAPQVGVRKAESGLSRAGGLLY